MTDIRIRMLHDTAADLMGIPQGRRAEIENQDACKIVFEISKAVQEIEQLKKNLAVARSEILLAEKKLLNARTKLEFS